MSVPELRRTKVPAGRARDLEGRLRTLIEQAPLAMHVFAPDGTSLLANAAWDELWDLQPGESSEGKNVFEDEQIRAAGLLPHVKEAVGGETVTTRPLYYEPARAGRESPPRWLKAFCYPVTDEAGATSEVSLIIEDVTERKDLERSLAHRAFHDELTGLPNRALLHDRLEHALSRAGARRDSEAGEKVAVLFMDLDNFKHVNDSLGHEAGDRLLVEVASRLKSCVVPGSTVARLGGDEFVVLLEDLEANQRAQDAAERIADGLRPPFSLDDRELFVTASIGVVVCDEVGSVQESPQDLLRSADVAMYRAKEGGKDRYAMFAAWMDGRSERRLTLESGLRRALKCGELAVVYQPLIDLKSDGIAGVEALVRWNHPERGTVPPSAFVPLAEETGLILDVGEQVLREACARAREWRTLWSERRQGGQRPTVWVNLSARQLFEPGLASLVADALREFGLDEPGSLGLEITESVAMDDTGLGIERTAATLRGLRDLGVRLAVDDFGTGYSSLSYLKRLPVDVLKLDRTFVSNLGSDDGDRAIVSAVLTLARDIGLEVVAEGVEKEEQLRVLRELGCGLVQGYYLARPQPAEQIQTWLGEGPRP